MQRILICALAIASNVNADIINESCTRICSHVEGDRVRMDPHCHQRCQADIHNCIESTVPQEERDGERYKCFQESLHTRIVEDGDILTKLAFDVPPTFDEFNELYSRDGRFDERDAKVLKEVIHGKPKWFDGKNDGEEIVGFFWPKIPEEKIQVVMDVYKEADSDGDGVVTEGEFNAYAKDSDVLSPADAGFDMKPDMPDLLAKKQAVFRSKKPQSSPEKNEMKQKGLTYFQHLLHLGLRVLRDEEKQPDPIEAVAVMIEKASDSKSSKKL